MVGCIMLKGAGTGYESLLGYFVVYVDIVS